MIKVSNAVRRANILLIALMFPCNMMPAAAQTGSIRNDVFWNTPDGRPIYSQGGGIFQFVDKATGAKKYYWYGVHYQEADTYRKDPSVTLNTKTTFESVTCYSSTDLVNWTFEADVLSKDEVNREGATWLGRLGVAYIEQLKKYAMVVQHGGKVMFAVSDSPTGQFKWHQEISMMDMIGTTNTGDQTVFTDDDGKSYLVYSYGRGRNKIYVSEIGVKNGKVDLLDCTQVFKGEGREGNCMFRYKGKYYMAASNLYGWDASLVYYLVADDVRGPYLPANEMRVMKGAAEDYGHVTQTGFFYTLKGSQQETVIYCGDRWANFAGNGLGYNQWFPISFEGNVPYFNSLSSWTLHSSTGAWKVNKDNNYVRNGSFEADRKLIPSPVKPLQDELTGWLNTVMEGNRAKVGDSLSPVLNAQNTVADRKFVIGEKSLNLSDRVNFKRKTSQTITSTPFVKLEDGRYNLTAKLKNSGGFSKLEMYAESNGKRSSHQVKNANASWQTITIKEITVKGGKAEIGFLAHGKANSFCVIDDVSFTRSM
jgi:hypothetical protein